MAKPRTVKRGTYDIPAPNYKGTKARSDRASFDKGKRVAVSPIHRRKPGYASRIRKPRIDTRITFDSTLVAVSVPSKLIA